MHKEESHKRDLLRQYIEGNISDADRHTLEKYALDDPFLFEAMEGYTYAGEEEQRKSILDVHNKLNKPKSIEKYPMLKWVSVAAGLLLVASVAFLIKSEGNLSVNESFASKEKSTSSTPVATVITEADDNGDATITPEDEAEIQSESATVEDINLIVEPQTPPRSVESPPGSADYTSQSKTESEDQDNVNENQNYSASQPTKLDRTQEASPESAEVKKASKTKASTEGKTYDSKANSEQIVEIGAEKEVVAQENKKEFVENAKQEKIHTSKKAADEEGESVYEEKSIKRKKAPVTSRDAATDYTVDGIRVEQIAKDKSGFGESKQNTIQGIVYDNMNTPLIGANVLAKGTSQGTVTDIDGKFTLSLGDAEVDQLLVTYTGFESQVIPLGKDQEYKIYLDEGQLLDEVVVTGYGASGQGSNAEPVDGYDLFAEYIQENIIIPENLEKSGNVTISFDVELNGELKNFKVVESLGSQADGEAIRLLREGGKWKLLPPKKQTAMQYSIYFRK